MWLDPAVSLAARPRCFGCRSKGSWLCRSCSADLVAPRCHDAIAWVDHAVIPWEYRGAARDLVLALKLRARRPAAAVLADAIVGALNRSGSLADVITWVPGRRKDVRVRGFDHAELIARELGVRIGRPVVGVLERGIERPDQTTLSGSQRRTNLKGAFVARAGPARVLLVDDLVTTGTTASECARALKGGGTTYLEVAAPCRV